MISYAAAAAVIYPGQQHGRPRLWKSSTGKFKYLLPVKAENTSAGSPCFRLWSVFQEMGFLFERFFQLHGSEFQEIYMLLDEKDNTLNSISLWKIVFKCHPNSLHMWVCLFLCFGLILRRNANTVCCGSFPVKEKVSILVLYFSGRDCHQMYKMDNLIARYHSTYSYIFWSVPSPKFQLL